MFDSQLLDFFWRVHPSVPVFIFVPRSWRWRSGAFRRSTCLRASASSPRLMLWTLFEYWLRRLIFHFEPGRNRRSPALDHPRRPPRPAQRPAAAGDAAAVSMPLARDRVRRDVRWCSLSSYAPVWRPASSPATSSTTCSTTRCTTQCRAADSQGAARAPHAPSLPGRYEGLWHQRALLGQMFGPRRQAAAYAGRRRQR